MYKSSPTQRAPSEPPEAVPSLSGRQLSADEDTLRQRLISAVQRPSGSQSAGRLADTLSLRCPHPESRHTPISADLGLHSSALWTTMLLPMLQDHLDVEAWSFWGSAGHTLLCRIFSKGDGSPDIWMRGQALAGAWRKTTPTRPLQPRHTVMSKPPGRLAMAAERRVRSPQDQSPRRRLLLNISGESFYHGFEIPLIKSQKSQT